MVNRADGGEHWIKITFDSVEAAEAATYCSPQKVLGHLVYAEHYYGKPPAKDEPCPDVDSLVDDEADHERSRSMPPSFNTPARGGGMPSSFRSRLLDLSPNNSHTSSQTLDTGTLSGGAHSSMTITDDNSMRPLSNSLAAGEITTQSQPIPEVDSVFCRRIPTAKKAKLLPAEQALLPQQSVMQRLLNAIPLVKWFGGSMIGNEVPRTETGEFDWNKASLYWKVIWWLDATFGLFSGDVSVVDKDD